MESTKAIELLCEKLGVTVEYLIPRVESYLIKQSIVYTIAGLLFGIIFGLIAFAIYSKGKKIIEDSDGSIDWDDMQLRIISIAVLAAVSFMCAVFFMVSLPDLVIHLTSPEVSAINYILKMIK